MMVSQFSWRGVVRLALIVPAAFVLLGAGSACGGSSGDSDATATTAPASPTSSDGNGDGDDGEPITIVMTDNVFTPSEIEVPVNTAVKITINNTGTAIHAMQVLSKAKEGKDFASDAIVTPGASSTFEVKFTKTGKYDFNCIYHLPAMSGVITVE